jgi:ribosome-binding ATPase YchF (GTP1/OBG family)
MVVRSFASDSSLPRPDRSQRQTLGELHSELILPTWSGYESDPKLGSLRKNASGKTARGAARLRWCASTRPWRRRCRSNLAIHNEEERGIAGSFGFLTLKPVIVVVNVDESKVSEPPPFAHEHAKATVALAAEIEAEISQLEDADKAAFLADLGLAEPARLRLIRTCYDAVGLVSMLTCGEDEVRAWTIFKNTPAVEAAGKIHSDIQRGFIRAETVSFDDLKANNDMRGAKAANKVRLEPKHYIVQDGDIINFRFNV